MSANNDAKGPSPLACLRCRRIHLKCDAQMPVCGRCRDTGSACEWKQSRRGHRQRNRPTSHAAKTTRNGNAHTITATPRSVYSDRNAPDSTNVFQGDSGYSGSSPDWSDGWADPLSTTSTLLEPDIIDDFAFDPSGAIISVSELESSSALRLPWEKSQPNGSGLLDAMTAPYNPPDPDTSLSVINGHNQILPHVPSQWRPLVAKYYMYMHAAHPFLAPHSLHASGTVSLPAHLQAAMAFAASYFVPGYSQDTIRQKASAMMDGDPAMDGFKVQALLIMTMLRWCRAELEAATATLRATVQLALRLRMYEPSYAQQNGRGIPQLEESWRRTWWEVYCLDMAMCIFAHSTYTPLLLDQRSDIPLPCEEDIYATGGDVQQRRTLAQFEQRQFAEENYNYSSFAYRIGAARLVGSLFRRPSNAGPRTLEEVDELDTSFAHYLVSLPSSKRAIIESDGRVDEMLFSAHMYINSAVIYLHRPFSDLVIVPNKHPTVCAPESAGDVPLLVQPEHTAKTVRAANALVHQAAIPSPLFLHCPHFTCALAMAASVHIPAYALDTRQDHRRMFRERLQLSVGALRAIGETWPVANAARMQVAAFARETFQNEEQVSILASDIAKDIGVNELFE